MCNRELHIGTAFLYYRAMNNMALPMSEHITETPSAEQIRQARATAGLTQADAAAVVHATDRAWRYWEAGDNQMPAPLWELFLIKTGQQASA